MTLVLKKKKERKRRRNVSPLIRRVIQLHIPRTNAAIDYTITG